MPLYGEQTSRHFITLERLHNHMTTNRSVGGTINELPSLFLCKQATSSGSFVEHSLFHVLNHTTTAG